MNIAIIDADLVGRSSHRFPNLACMKISGYHKSLGDNVSLIMSFDKDVLGGFDYVYISKVFTDTDVPSDILSLPNVSYGGTGFFYDKAEPLKYEIEHSFPDYHLYDDFVEEMLAQKGANGKPRFKKSDFKYYTDYSIGFMTRGCFRKCEFCVNKKYNKSSLHSPLSEFLDESRPKICLLDDNVLACKEWRDIFEQLQATNKKFQFRQGMDERILTEEKVACLKASKYDGDYIFAFDDIKDKNIVLEKAKLLRKYFTGKGHNIKFYVLCAFDKNGKYDDEFWVQDIKNTFERVFILASFNFKPYIMRYAEYKNSKYKGVYINLAQWCNQPSFFSNYSYKGFFEKYDDYNTGGKRTSAAYRYYKEFENVFENYTMLVPKEIAKKNGC